jgi:hypothetical protein
MPHKLQHSEGCGLGCEDCIGDPRLIHGWHPLLQSRGALPTAGVEECTHMIDVNIASVGSTLLIKDCTGSTRCNTVKDVD